jgi:hypothetical protein
MILGGFMESVKEIFLALIILTSSGVALEKIHNRIRFMALEKAHQGLVPMTHFTSKLTGISLKRIEQGYLE